MPSVSYVARRVFPLACSLVLACNSEKLGPPLPGQDTLFWDLKLNHHAVTLSMTAPYDTLQVVATPRNIDKEPLTGLPAVTYVSKNSAQLRVTPDGVLVPLTPTGPSSQTVVVATLTVGNLTHKDSMFVRIVTDPNPPVLHEFSAHPLPPDSAKSAAIRYPELNVPIKKSLRARATDINGASIANPLVFYSSSEPNLIVIHPLTGAISYPLAGLSGNLNLVAEMTAFGVHRVDTVPYRVGLPIFSEFNFQAREDGLRGSLPLERELHVGRGAAVVFRERVNGDGARLADRSVDIDIVFDDPTHVEGYLGKPIAAYAIPATFLCQVFAIGYVPSIADCTNGGNVMLRAGTHATLGSVNMGFGARVFPKAGVYNFHSELNGFRGRIVVVDESE